MRITVTFITGMYFGDSGIEELLCRMSDPCCICEKGDISKVEKFRCCERERSNLPRLAGDCFVVPSRNDDQNQRLMCPLDFNLLFQKFYRTH